MVPGGESTQIKENVKGGNGISPLSHWKAADVKMSGVTRLQQQEVVPRAMLGIPGGLNRIPSNPSTCVLEAT